MNATPRPKILTLVSHYLPGFKAGGPIRSVANLVAALGDEFDFRILTRDRDVGDVTAYPNIHAAHWQPVGGASVCYTRSTATPLRIVREIGRIRPDIIYANSFFDALHCLPALLAARLPSRGRTPIVIAPRGQFAPGSMQFQPRRKMLYLKTLQRLGLTHNICWHATSEGERDDICRLFGPDANIFIASNLSGSPGTHTRKSPKQPGRLRIAFLSRVSPKKNLAGAIEIIAPLAGQVTFDIWGPVEDSAYEQSCRRRIAALPANISATWRGPVEPAHVSETLAQYDALLLPTFGENFGHAIVEALGAGCPVLISNRTPWRNLESHAAGWDISLEDPAAFRRALTTLCTMNESEHASLRAQAADFARSATRTAEHTAAHRELFEQALSIHPSRVSLRTRRAA